MAKPTLRTVLLRHQLPDGSAHFDWMLQTSLAATAGLTTFRVDPPIHHPEIDLFDAEMIGVHRPMYLTYQGPLSDERGFVERVASGTVEVMEASDAGYRVVVTWFKSSGVPGPRRSWLGTPLAGRLWRFVADPSASRAR